MNFDLNLIPSRPVWNDLVNALLIFAIMWILSRLLRLVFNVVEKKIVSRTRTQLDDTTMNAVRRPLTVLIWLLGLKWALQSINISAFGLLAGEAEEISRRWVHGLDGFFYVILALVIVTLVTRLINAVADWYISIFAETTESRADVELVPLMKRIFQIVAYVVTAIIVLDHFGVNVSALVVTLGAGTLAIALALQETLSNMIAGFVLFVDRPFRIGDRVLLENSTLGDVTEIGIRSTKIITFDNTIVVVPNAEIIKEKITNYSYPDPKIRVLVEFGVAYASDLEEVKRLIVDVAKRHPKILDDPEPVVHFLGFGDSSLDMRLVARTADYREQWVTTEEVRMGIWRILKENRIEIPFPQRDVWFRNKPAKE